MPTYNRADLAFERGEGAWLWTADGRRFLDFGSGIATASIGHGHPHLVQAIAEQAAKVMHTSNLYRIPQAERLAQRLVDTSFADSVFFGNSGAEANEGMIKAVRKYHAENGHPERNVTICFEGAFHGRTLATLAATGNEKYLAGFGPPMPGFKHVPFGNMNAAARRRSTAPPPRIMVEPIQGEGGVRPASLNTCATCARPATSSACCWRSTRCRPAWAAPASSGPTNGPGSSRTSCPRPRASAAASRSAPSWPRRRWPRCLKPGTHGSTYGGNPLACTAGNAVLDVILAAGFLDRRATASRGICGAACWPWRNATPTVIEGIQGAGLLLGIKLKPEVANGDIAGRRGGRGAADGRRRDERAAPGAAAHHHRGRGGRGAAAARPRHAAHHAVPARGRGEMSSVVA